MRVRAFDDTTPEGISFSRKVPLGSINLVLRIYGRAASAPVAIRTVGNSFWYKKRPDQAAQPAWTQIAQSDLSINADANYKYHQITVTLASMSLVGGDLASFVWQRKAPLIGTNLVGDFYVYFFSVDFT
jgi:hypothetical protein